MPADQAFPVSEQAELDRFFGEARRFPLLDEQREREIDGRKWSAVHDLQAAMVRDAGSRRFLEQWSAMCLCGLPDIAAFAAREHHFLLRRELTDFLPAGKRSSLMVDLHEALSADAGLPVLLRGLRALELPASLVAGLADVVAREAAEVEHAGVGGALQAWMELWPTQVRMARPAPAARARLLRLLEAYLEQRNTLMMHNLRLVYAIAGRYRGKGLPLTDLVQEGTLGLLRAAEKFQAVRGYRFSTYAYNWIQQSIKRGLADSAGTIRYPNHVQEQLGRLYGKRSHEMARLGAEPGDATLASAAGLSLQKTRELLQLRNLALSLDAPQFEEDGDTTLLDSLPGGPFADTASDAEQSSLNKRLLLEIQQLEPAEQQVVISRWGLYQGPPLSRAEIADKMSVSREWVRQLERSALEKLRDNDMVRSVYLDHRGSIA